MKAWMLRTGWAALWSLLALSSILLAGCRCPCH
jgi:hypothetical protein